jgi:hypothetical protein
MDKSVFVPVLSPAGALAKSIMDPFSGQACIPDGSVNNGCFSLEYTYTLNTGAGTATSLALQFDPNSWVYRDVGSAAATFTLPAGANWLPNPQAAAITNMFARWRAVSMGISVTFNTSTTTDQGQCVVAQLPSTFGASGLSGLDCSGIQARSMKSQIGNLKEPISITWRPEDQDDYIFRSFNANATLPNVAPLSWLFFGVTGAASNVALATVRVIANYEGQYLTTVLRVGDQSKKQSQPAWYETALEFIKPVAQIATAVSKLTV